MDICYWYVVVEAHGCCSTAHVQVYNLLRVACGRLTSVHKCMQVVRKLYITSTLKSHVAVQLTQPQDAMYQH